MFLINVAMIAMLAAVKVTEEEPKMFDEAQNYPIEESFRIMLEAIC